MEEDLRKYLGQVIALSHITFVKFGVLQYNEELKVFGFDNTGFSPDSVEKITPIEAKPEDNLARAHIKLK